jgi:ubiquinone/menaquinone biosynthesis C-methylase UbiE
VGVYRKHLQPRLLEVTLGSRSTQAIRGRVCAGLRGDVVEIGYGSGLNQPHLPPEVRSVAALEPSLVALGLGAGRRAASGVPVTVAGNDAQQIPLPDDSFDAALSTWTLCGIPDPLAALREVCRVLRPGGVLHFVEHGLAPDDAVVRWQRRANALNKRLAGCVLDRDVGALLAASGLDVLSVRTYYEKGSPRPVGFFYEGTARA